MERITDNLCYFKQLHSLNLSFNLAKDTSPEFLENLVKMMTYKTKLNHLNVSYMALGFNMCQTVVTAASQSMSLCALHISGNQLSRIEQRFLLRILAIKE